MKWTTGKLFIVAAVVLVFIIFYSVMHKKSDSAPSLTTQAMPHDKASGDTNEEVIKTFAKELADVKGENTTLQKQITSLSTHADEASLKVIDTLRAQVIKNETQMKQLAVQMRDASSTDKNNYAVQTDSLDDSPHVIHEINDISQAPPLSPEEVLALSRAAKKSASAQTTNDEAVNTVEPYYSIPPGTNAIHTTLLTALLGEVPNNGTFQQPPFPFQGMIGRKDLLAANGKELPPEVGGMKISGYAIGVGSFLDNLSCTRVYITQAVYIFNDGHISVIGKNQDTKDVVNPSETLGYLSDPWGNTCIPGEYITNAPRVLAALTATGVVSGFGSAISQAQTTTYTGSQDANTVMNGSTVKYGLGTGLSYGMNQATDWMLDRLKGSFDLVYVPASQDNHPTQVVANFTQMIPIDLDEKSRKLRYEHTSEYQVQATTLD